MDNFIDNMVIVMAFILAGFCVAVLWDITHGGPHGH